jgi:cell division protein FtsI/penicillin-binding protein 2
LAHGKDAKEFTHSWFIGYAPADNPKIAFAVMVEYAGAGGAAAVPMAKQVLEACIAHGYLSK